MTEPSPTVLLVEDEDDLRSLWTEFLVQRGYDVHGARSVDEVRAATTEGLRPSLAVVDWSLPDGDGSAVTAHLAHDVPVILCSGDRGQLPDAAVARAAAVLQKPFRLGELARAVAEVVPPRAARS